MYTGYELLWLFFVCSIGGWICETVFAAVRQKKFVNKGLVNLPFCVIYGIVQVFITIFGRELKGIWLYFGAVILITVFQWSAGRLIERIFCERWWDCSDRPLNMEGHVSIIDAAFWGLGAVAMMRWGNSLLIKGYHLLPEVLGHCMIWVLAAALAADVLATLLGYYVASKNKALWENLDQSFTEFTASLSGRIYRRVAKRIRRAYPQARKLERAAAEQTVFAQGCGFYKLVWLFMTGCLLGDITETIYCRLTGGIWMSRSSVVWGPFSIVWGLAIAVFTALLYRYKEKSDGTIFFAGTVLGGAYEYVCSVFTEMVFGKVFWDYSDIRFNLGGRINLLYCFFWGIAAVVWIKHLYPMLSVRIEKIPINMGKALTWLMVVFMSCNILVSGLALIRSSQRQEGIDATQSWQLLMDERFPEERLERIYPNAVAR